MTTSEGEKPTIPAPQGQAALPLGQVGDEATSSEDSGIPDVSIRYAVPKDSQCETCPEGTAMFDDPEDKTRRWVACKVGLALATGNLPVILEQRSQETSECPGLKASRILLTHINTQVAKAASDVARSLQERLRVKFSSKFPRHH